jgi:PiT family inorganic phosphate transporter
MLLAVTVFLAYANGANDNFKGVASLYGCGALGYRQALVLATLGQVAGSIASLFLAELLVKAFSGSGLVPPDASASSPFLTSVGLGAGATVMLATVLGFPISTTHALTGALVGAALVANMGSIDASVLGRSFLIPLLVSPLLACVTTAPLYLGAHRYKERKGFSADTCFCVEPEPITVTGAGGSATLISRPAAFVPQVVIAPAAVCERRRSYRGRLVGIGVQAIVDNLHYASAFALCFARGLNDTQKVFALLCAASAFQVDVSLGVIAVAMAAGGCLNARRVAERMSKGIAAMNEGQALIANIVASFYVIASSNIGLPVSTTHVTVGAITGVGMVNGTADYAVIRDIFLSWVLTLPVAAAIGSAALVLLRSMGI